jgi:Mor family transcriptional regulator
VVIREGVFIYSHSLAQNTFRRCHMKLGDNRRAFTEKQEKNVCRSYSGGKGAKDISRDYGVSYRTVLNVLKRHGVYKNKKALRAQIVEAFDLGMGVSDLSSHFGVRPSLVYGALREGKRDIKGLNKKIRHEALLSEGLIERYLSGERVQDLANECGKSTTTVYAFLKDMGAKRRGRDVVWSELESLGKGATFFRRDITIEGMSYGRVGGGLGALCDLGLIERVSRGFYRVV